VSLGLGGGFYSIMDELGLAERPLQLPHTNRELT